MSKKWDISSRGVLGRLKKSSLAHILGMGSNLLIRIFSIPLFLAAWGTELYGEWLIVTSIPAYLALSDLGLNTAVGNEMVKQASNGDYEGATVSYQTLLGFILRFAVPAGALLVFASSWVPLTSIGIEILSKSDFMWIISLAITGILMGLIAGTLNTIFRSSGRYPYSDMASSVSRIVGGVGLMVALFFKLSCVQVAVVVCAERLFHILFLAFGLRQITEWRPFGFARYRGDLAFKQLKVSLAYLANTLGQALVNQGFIIVIGKYLGRESVVVFSTIRTAANILVQLAQVPLKASITEITFFHGKGEWERALAICGLVTWLSTLGTLFGGSVVYFFGEPLFLLWLSDPNIWNASLAAALLGAVAVRNYYHPVSMICFATNNFNRWSVGFLIINGVALGFGVMLGLMGPDLLWFGGLLLAVEVAMTAVTFTECSRTLKMKIPALFWAITRYRPLKEI
ncbi:MAG: hypothetical protein CMH56_16385 [Myxococcales bacterium]|nr:hypothetical protein [Myxococcales bacterium]|tara:strand:+ start:1298 stop:2665 length:1368 start_codon:yes stop_codon:yes gene_type:complete